MVSYQKLKHALFALLVIHPFLTNGQRGYTLTNESGDIIVTVRDTIDTGNGIIRKSETIEFPDSTAAANYLESLKDNYFANAYKLAQLAHADSVTANRIRQIGSDSGLFSIGSPSIQPAPDQPPLIIERPDILPDKKPKQPTKKKPPKKNKPKNKG